MEGSHVLPFFCLIVRERRDTTRCTEEHDGDQHSVVIAGNGRCDHPGGASVAALAPAVARQCSPGSAQPSDGASPWPSWNLEALVFEPICTGWSNRVNISSVL